MIVRWHVYRKKVRVVMTENEAIRDLDIIRFNPHWDELVNEEYWQDLMEMATKALEEVQQYRKIGSVELFAETKKLSDLTKKCGTIGKVFDECAEYAAIGTVEKCREAVEKQTAKRPEFVDTRFMNNGKYISDGCQLQKCYKCPNCNQHIFHVWDDELYCKYCGQHIDWRANDGKID